MTYFSKCFGCLLLAYAPLSAASYTTYAEAQATLGNANQFLSNFLSPSFDRQKDAKTDAPAATSASIIYQKINEWGEYQYRVQALGTANASPGELKAYAGAGWTAGFGYTVSAKADAAFTDRFTLQGPAGSNALVDVLLTLNMGGGTIGNTQASGELRINNNPYISFNQSTLSPASFYCSWPVSGACGGSMTVKLPVNTSLSLSAAIAIQAAAGSSQTSSMADYSHTANIWFEVLDSNYQLVSASGHRYIAPVPLPSALVLFVSSFLMAGLGSRRSLG